MRFVLPLVSVLTLWPCFAGESKPPQWPEIGSRWDTVRAGTQVPAERLGTSLWEKPPAVISPYEAHWFDYVPIVWGGDQRLPDPSAYAAALRKMFVCGGLNYSQDEPDGFVKSRMPFYCTNLCNQLYLPNKSGPTIREAFKRSRTRENCVRIPSLDDPQLDQTERKNAREVAKRCTALALKPLGYDLRDEASYSTGFANPHDFDFSPVSLAAFRKWLKLKYGTLEALSTEWEVAFPFWDAVTPLMTDEIQEREFKRIAKANFSPWADHREYNDDTYFAAVCRYRDAIRLQDPGAPVGYSGTQLPSPWGGFDFWKVGNTVGWIEYYDCNGSRELLRSFMPRAYPAIAAIPFNSVDDGLNRLWSYILHGDAGGLVWPYGGHDVSKTLLLDVQEGQATLTPKGANLKAIFQEARSGIPCLLRRSEPVTDAIGVLYSQASLRADWIFEVKREGKAWNTRYSSHEEGHNFAAAGRESYFKLLEDLGLQYTCFADEQVARGELLKRGIKLFLVPRGLALSKPVAAALIAFVEAGGVLVTDVMAGRMNENCRVWPEEPGPLDALLGLQRAPFAFEEETKEKAKEGYVGGFGRTLEITMESDFGILKSGEKFSVQGYQEPGVQAGTAKALGKSATGPVLLEHAQGKGYAYTLNFDLPNYLAQRAEKDALKATAVSRRIVRALVQKAGIEPVVKVRAKGSDEHPMGLETFHYSLGTAEIFALHLNGSVRISWEDLSDAGAGVNIPQGLELSIQLPKKGFVTEMRSGKSFGQTDRVELKTVKDRPVILSLLPYEVKALKAEWGAGKIADGRLPLEISIEAGGEVLDHVVHAELLDEKGEVVPESVINIPLPKGRYKGALDLSFVPGAGPWNLKLTDVASGKKADAKVSK